MPSDELTRSVRLKARWVFPITSPPLENGVLEIREGRITRCGPWREFAGEDSVIDLGSTALIPGLVNAHTHLEFSDLAHPVQPAMPFTAWIRSLVGVRRNHPATAQVLQTGLTECRDSGTTLVGEIATQDWPDSTYSTPGIESVVFREILGLRRDQATIQLEVARKWLDGATPRPCHPLRGISPHAPYSVHPELYSQLIDLAVSRQAPVAIHLAETQAELELLAHGTGEFAAMLQQFGVWDDQAIPKGSRPLDYLIPLANLPRALVIHGNYLDQSEISWLAQHPHISVVYCPRTHAFFGHTPHPWIRLVEAGVNVAIGTDSRGSNPDLKLWNELRWLYQLWRDVSESRRSLSHDAPTTKFSHDLERQSSHSCGVNPAKILEMGTLCGAKALGLEAETGSLEVGKRSHLALVQLPQTPASNPYELLFSANSILSYTPSVE